MGGSAVRFVWDEALIAVRLYLSGNDIGDSSVVMEFSITTGKLY